MAISGQFSNQDIENETSFSYVQEVSRRLNGTEFTELPETEIIPFSIPNNWCWCRLSDIGTTNIGLTYHPEDVVLEGIPIMRSSNIVNNKMDYSDLVSVNCDVREKQYLNKGDILICARNGSKTLVGKCAIYDGEIGQTAFGAFMAAFRSDCNEYLYLFFQTKAFRRYFENDNNKQINQVTQKILKDAVVPIPPLAEQRRIVERVNAVFDVLDTIDELQSAYSSDLEVLKSKIIDAGIQGKLTEQLPEDGNAEDLYAAIQEEKARLIKEKKIKKSKALPEITEDEIPFEIPDNWKWVRLGNIISISSGQGLTSSQMIEGDIPVFGGNGITGYHNQSLVNKETVVIGRVGVYCGSVHITPPKAWITDNAFITTFPEEYVDRDYLALALKQMHLGGNTNGAAQPVVSGKKIYPMLFPLPPFSEQIRIVEKIDNILGAIS